MTFFICARFGAVCVSVIERADKRQFIFIFLHQDFRLIGILHRTPRINADLRQILQNRYDITPRIELEKHPQFMTGVNNFFQVRLYERSPVLGRHNHGPLGSVVIVELYFIGLIILCDFFQIRNPVVRNRAEQRTGFLRINEYIAKTVFKTAERIETFPKTIDQDDI